MAYQPSAVASPCVPGSRLAQGASDGDDAVRGVAVAGTAEEREAAGAGERAIEAHAQLARGELNGGGEARVEIDVRDVVGAGAGMRECRPSACSDRGRAVEAIALER